MLLKEQIVKQMAVPIHEGNCCTSWEQALKSAESALQALLGSLPGMRDIKDRAHDINMIEGVRASITEPQMLAGEYYRQLLKMRSK